MFSLVNWKKNINGHAVFLCMLYIKHLIGLSKLETDSPFCLHHKACNFVHSFEDILVIFKISEESVKYFL